MYIVIRQGLLLGRKGIMLKRTGIRIEIIEPSVFGSNPEFSRLIFQKTAYSTPAKRVLLCFRIIHLEGIARILKIINAAEKCSHPHITFAIRINGINGIVADTEHIARLLFVGHKPVSSQIKNTKAFFGTDI